MLNFTPGRESDILRGKLAQTMKYSLSASNEDGLEAGLPSQSNRYLIGNT